MPLFEFLCKSCQIRFEQISRVGSEDYGRCPQCDDATHSERIVSRFFTQGRGDVRETGMFHGCHTAHPGHDKPAGENE